MRVTTAAIAGRQAGCRLPGPARRASLVTQIRTASRRSGGKAARQAAAPENPSVTAAPPPAAAAASSTAKTATKEDVGSAETLTERMFRLMEENAAAGAEAQGAGGTTSLKALRGADAAWRDLRTRRTWGPKPEFVRLTRQKLGKPADVDVVVCGGTLGIFLACSLQLQGLKVAVLERGPLLGRSQEWNISRKELKELVELGVLSEQEAEDCVSVEFNPVRIGFHGDPPRGGVEIMTRDVLNLGVSPARLVEAARRRFEAAGGRVLDRTPLSGVWVHPDGVALQLGSSTDPSPSSSSSSNGNGSSNGSSNGNGKGSSNGASAAAQQQQEQQPELTARLVLDCMGNASPIVQQVRWGHKPNGICLVVGSNARGFDPAQNTTGDVIYTNSHSEPEGQEVSNTQLFWEAFPSGSGPGDRTTYMFTYVDAVPNRPSLEAMMELYWKLMPQYQGVQLDDLVPRRILFGWFPTYRASPLPPKFPRVLQVGDASGIQSPLSFGGFGALTRHLGRLTRAITEALEVDALGPRQLGMINAYNPGLSGAWMLQRAMSIRANARGYNREFINRLLSENFKAMEKLGDPVLKPFLQDVIQLGPLVKALTKQMIQDPLFVPQILLRVGPIAMLDWLLHLVGLAFYTFLNWDVQKYKPLIEKLPPKPRYMMRRAMEMWEFGAGKDFKL